MVESALSVVVLCACFSLIFWNGLIHRKLSRVRRSFYTGWLYFPETPYVSCALQVAWLATSGYLLWSGTEPYAPAQLLDRCVTLAVRARVTHAVQLQWPDVHGCVCAVLPVYWR